MTVQYTVALHIAHSDIQGCIVHITDSAVRNDALPEDGGSAIAESVM